MKRIFDFSQEEIIQGYLLDRLETEPGFNKKDVKAAIVLIHSTLDVDAIASLLESTFPFPVVGVTTHYNLGFEGLSSGIKLVLLDSSLVSRVRIGLVQNTGSEEQILEAYESMGCDSSYKGIVFTTFDQNEELLIERLNIISPMSWFGGTASDQLSFVDNRIIHGGETHFGMAVLLAFKEQEGIEAVFTQIRSFENSEHTVTPTKLSENGRILYELDGLPAAEVYAEIYGVSLTADKLKQEFFAHPLGMVFDEITTFIKSPADLTPDGGILMASGLSEGMEYAIQNPVDMVAHTKQVLNELGDTELIFNVQCAYRTLQNVMEQRESEYYSLFAGKNMVGFSSLGEYYCTHVNHTSTLLAFRKK